MENSSNLILLSKLGIYIRENALDSHYISEILHKTKDSNFNLATVNNDDGNYSVNQNERNTKILELNTKLSDDITKFLLNSKKEVGIHFNLSLSNCQEPQLLKYKKGDFFKKHVDRSEDEDGAEFSRKRRISAVIFLNSQEETPQNNCYTGGSLVFYGLMKSGSSGDVAIPLNGKKGLLVCFKSNIVHEVTPVTNGTRYTLVSWYT